MLISCWSVKGGSGTTVVATGLAVLMAKRLRGGALLVDLGGDAPAVLGLPEPQGPGILDWAGADLGVQAEAIERLTVEVGHGLRLVPRGEAPEPPTASDVSAIRSGRLASGLSALARADRAVVVDAGLLASPAFDLISTATLSLMVLRPCFLAVKRAVAAPLRPSGVVLVEEQRRSLDAVDVEEVLGVPVLAQVPWDPAIARAVDAGLLAGQLPRALGSALRDTA